MQFIIAFVVIILLILLGKYILFSPRVNSVITIIWFAIIVIHAPGSIVLIIIPIIDCIRDIMIAEDYYEDLEIGIDKLFMIKSLTSILTLGFARVIFLFIVGPIISRSVSSDIKKKIAAGQPMPYKSLYSKLKARNYYYAKKINMLEQEGVVIANIKTVDDEANIRRKKFDELYPEKLLAKLTDMVAGDKEIKEKRKEAEKKLKPWSIKECYAYLSFAVFEQYPKLISEVMSKKGTYSPSVIKDFKELKDLQLPLVFNSGNDKSMEWSEFFIIQALQPLVADGIFEDNDFSDNDALNTHAYRYSKSEVPMPSIDASNDPLLALDDD